MSLLEMCLVISMKKLMEQDVNAFNFEIIYDFYHQFAIQHNIGFRRAVAFKVL
jgi:origin recognition complex subunit 4